MREDLYRQVWSKPATRLAEELGISDVAIAKICKKLNVPKPRPGYWRQVEVGRGAQPPPLPKAETGVPSEVVIYPNSAGAPFRPQSLEILALIEAESQSNNRIHVAQHLRNAHPLIVQAREILEKAGPDFYGLLRPNWNQPCLDIHVSKSALRRVLLIMDALLKALEARGYRVEVSKNGNTSTKVVVGDQKLKIRLSEKTDRSENVLTNADKSKPSSMMSDRWSYTPSGKLVFNIDEYWSDGGRKRWADRIRKPLEEQLNEVVAGIITAAEGLRLRAIRFQEEQRKWHEAQLRRQEEERRRKAFESQAELWVRAQNLRAFLRACEASILERLGTVAPDSPEARWLAWAIGYVDRLDPLKNGDLEKLILQFSKTR